MTFTTWLLEQRDRRDPVGDLAYDAADDDMFPPVATGRVIASTWRSRNTRPTSHWMRSTRRGESSSGLRSPMTATGALRGRRARHPFTASDAIATSARW